MKIVVSLPDAHFPYNIPFRPIWKYLHDLKPTVIQWLGDAWNLELIGHWDHQEKLKELGLQKIRQRLNEEAGGLRKLIKGTSIACGPQLKEVIYFEGNHEAWIRQYQALYGNVGDPISLESYLRPKETGITKFVDQGDSHRIGHVTWIHGDNYSGGSLWNIAKKILDDYETNVRFGHFHGVTEVSKASAMNRNEKKAAVCIGTLGTLNAVFMKHRPHQWQNAFEVTFFQDSGFFNDYIVRIINGKFVAPNGRLYQ